MTGAAAILERELRQTVRRRTLYRLRTLGALAGLGMSILVLLPYLVGGKSGSMGHDAFAALVWLAFGFGLLAGPVLAADLISEEKREGTLGLLMLTPLRSYEVVAGKLLAVGMPGFQVLLAIVPVFSLTFFMGGVTAGELGRAMVVLGVSLWLSLCVALACSCVARRAMNSMAAATVLLALLAAALPFYQTTPGTGLLHSELLGWCSPTHAIRLLPDLEYARAPATFWAGVGTVALLGLVALGVGGWMLARSWRSVGRVMRIPRVLQRSIGPGPKATRDRGTSVSADAAMPFIWLSDRLGTGLRWTWVLVTASGLASVLVFLDQAGTVFSFAPLFLSFYCGNGALKLWVAWHASHRLAEDRRSGALEMMLCLPVDEREVWGGWLGLLKRRLFWPMTLLLTLQAGLLVAGLVLWDPDLGEGLYLAITFLVLAVFLVADAYTVCWSALNFSLGSRSSAAALSKTMLWVLLLPALPFAAAVAGGMPTSPILHFGGVLIWVGMSLTMDLFESARAHVGLTEGFRESLARTWQEPTGPSPAWKALSGVRKRLLARTIIGQGGYEN